MITPSRTKSLANNKNGIEVVEINEVQGQDNTKNRKLRFLQSMSLMVLKLLDLLLLLILLPFLISQWMYSNDEVKVVLKAVVQVVFELIVWIIFAGVSIVMATAFALEDIYIGNTNLEKSQRPAKRQESSSSDIDVSQSLSVTPKKLKVSEN